MKIEDAVALVTGSNRGLGASLAAALLAAGVKRVYAASRGPSVGGLDPGRVVPVSLDVTDEVQVAAAAARCGDVSIVINNAGVNHVMSLIGGATIDGAREEMETNYFGTLRMCRAFAPVLAKNGGGAIVNLLSVTARANLPLMGTLSASKAAALSLTQGVRAELRKQGTLVVGVLPGAINTDMARSWQGPKDDPAMVAAAVVEALRAGTEEIYPGEFAGGVAKGLAHDARAVEQEFGRYLP
jgi:NAD(P)-dependent dehydrogenase (short-subunit alcohol dehydrogenase family)